MSKQDDDYCRMCGGCGLSKYNRFEEAEEARCRKADAEAAAFLQAHPNASEAEYAAFAEKRARETCAKGKTASMPDELALSRSVDEPKQAGKESTPIYAVLIGLLLALVIGALAGSFLTGHVRERAFSDSSQTAIFSETEL